MGIGIKVADPKLRDDEQPSAAKQVLRAIPATIVASASMAFTSWFGSTHYLPEALDKISDIILTNKLLILYEK